MTLACMRTGCSAAEQLAIPVIYAWAVGMAKVKRGRLTMVVPLWTCAPCRAVTTIEHIVTDEAWSQILATFAERRLLTPDRASAELEWVHGSRAHELLARFEAARQHPNGGILH